MIFDFDFHEMRESLSIACYEGEAHVIGATDGDWQIDGISLLGRNAVKDARGHIVDWGRPGQVALAETDALYKKLMVWLLTEQAQRIEDAWQQALREARAA